MRRALPFSLIFFLATAIVFLLQAIPIIGIALMFMLAPFWSVLLVNAGMIGIAMEAAFGWASRLWLVLPLVFYSGYWSVAAQDHQQLSELAASYDAANGRIITGFDPQRHALVFDKDGNGGWLTQNFELPVAYTMNANFPEGFLSDRMMERAVCEKVRSTPALRAAFIYTFGFHDGDAIGDRTMEERFCALKMPERPQLPLVRVSHKEEKFHVKSLPVTRTTTTIAMPDGRRFQLLGGVGAPLSWIPMPVFGCGLNSAAPSWDCRMGFWRDSFTPIVSGNTRYGRDSAVLANALGLKHVSIAKRRGSDPTLVMKNISRVEKTTLARQLANIDAMIANPLDEGADWKVDVVTNHPEALDSRADAIMSGIERAAVASGDDRYRARESGRILAGLLAKVQSHRFIGYRSRILAVYANADDKHWLWESEPLMRRLGALGTDALPYLVDPRASRASNGASVEGLCRVGSAGVGPARPVLLTRWTSPRSHINRDERAALFVAMRRIGITPPPLTGDRRNQYAELQTEWADISPASPATVCATRAESQARRARRRGSGD